MQFYNSTDEILKNIQSITDLRNKYKIAISDLNIAKQQLEKKQLEVNAIEEKLKVLEGKMPMRI